MRKIEIAANVVIILSGLFIAVRLVKPELLTFASRAASPRPVFQVSALPVDWSAHSQTLVLALQTGCHYCTESAPFYQRLTAAAQRLGKVHLVAVLPQKPSASRQYLEALHVPFADVRQAELAALGVPGTPAAILVDRQGKVSSVWMGKLSATQETELLQAVAAN